MTEWPTDLRGITESIVTTPTETDTWNVAALGLHAESPVRARTWGQTRTRRNFDRAGRGVIHFPMDPVAFVTAALGIHEVENPVLPDTAAAVRVSVVQTDAGQRNGTSWVDWAVYPEEVTVERRVVPAINRGFNAVIEASVAASRLGVPAYETADLAERIRYCESVARRCGGPREHEAIDRLFDLAPGITRRNGGSRSDSGGKG